MGASVDWEVQREASHLRALLGAKGVPQQQGLGVREGKVNLSRCYAVAGRIEDCWGSVRDQLQRLCVVAPRVKPNVWCLPATSSSTLHVGSKLDVTP